MNFDNINRQSRIFLLWIFNPLFLLYGRDKEREDFEMQEGKEDYFPYYDLRFPMLNVEGNICNSSKHIEIKKIMYSFFEFTFEYKYESKDTAILSTTFFLSISIATNRNLREKFYASFQGKIPAITQFLLNAIRLGPIDDDNGELYVSDFKLDSNWEYIVCLSSLRGKLFDTEYLQETEEGFLDLIKWFELLEQYCAPQSLFFTHFVSLTKTPIDGTDLTSLLGFHHQKLQFFIHSSISKDSNLTKKYFLLNKVLHAKLVTFDEYSEEKEEENALEDEANFLNDDDPREQELVSQLFDLIINCSAKDLTRN